MTALPLLFLAMTATSVLAEPTVHLREQFEDGGESFTQNKSFSLLIPELQSASCTYTVILSRNIHKAENEWLNCFLCFSLLGGKIVFFVFVPPALFLIKCFDEPLRLSPSPPLATIPQ